MHRNPQSNSKTPWAANSASRGTSARPGRYVTKTISYCYNANFIQGMEELIKQAFLHVEVIGPHVPQGHYDLVGPDGEIILPQVWETMVQPDWAITMHMWPMPEPPPPEMPREGLP